MTAVAERKTGPYLEEPITDLNTLPETEEVKTEFNPTTELQRAWIDPGKDVPEPPVMLNIGGIATLTAGNISTIIGKAKSKKTFFTMGLLSAISTGSWGKLEGRITDKTVLWFDTEQSIYHASRMVKRCHQLGAGNIKAYSLRGYSPAQRVQLIESAVYNTPDLGFVAIDGQRDLLTRGINDEEEATEITSKFLKWTADLGIHICLVLHTNKGDNNARGHIGTELINKSECVISVVKSEQDESISVVSPEYSRNMDFEPFAFTIGDDHLPIMEDIPTTQGRNISSSPSTISSEKHFEILGAIFKRENKCKYSELWLSIKLGFAGHGVEFGDNRAKEYLKYYQNNEWIKKDGSIYSYNRAIF